MIWHTVGIALAAAAAGAAASWQVQDWRRGRLAAEIQAHTATAREEAMHGALVETARRLTAQQEAARHAQIQTRAARADAADAADAAERLQLYAQGLARACAADPAAEPGSAPAGRAGLVFADVLGRLEANGRELAAEADRRGIAGAACERGHDALRAGG